LKDTNECKCYHYRFYFVFDVFDAVSVASDFSVLFDLSFLAFFYLILWKSSVVLATVPVTGLANNLGELFHRRGGLVVVAETPLVAGSSLVLRLWQW